jgi:hypothetical protein
MHTRLTEKRAATNASARAVGRITRPIRDRRSGAGRHPRLLHPAIRPG